MKLIHKNFLYTAIITGILTVLVLGYFILMLPSLYVDYMSSENYDSIIAQHEGYLKDGSYKNVAVKSPGCLSIEIPFHENPIVLSGKAFQITITPSTDDMKALLSDIKTFVKSNIHTLQDMEKLNQKEVASEWKEKALEWKTAFLKQVTFLDKVPFSFETQSDSSYYKNYMDASTKFHYYSDDTIFIESGVRDGENQYTNYAGLTYNSDHIVISVFSVVTPKMNEITPIVIRSLPMLLAVILLFALVVSYLYSKGIVDPIIRLVKHTEAVKRSGITANAALVTKGKDEIAILVQTLNGLYEELGHNYKALENINMELNQKYKSQEVFLRASSHQLKTPIAAALLLVDGMMNQIGKYQDVKAYLPQVKKQLQSMQKIVEDILYMNRCEENITLETVDLNTLVQGQLACYQITLAEGNYKLVTDYSDGCYVTTDSNLLLKILDNLISNALVHSKKGATITISTKPYQLEIHNSGAHIDENLMPNIFEPFVSAYGKGHGLGLYIVSYYANILNVKIKISNEKDGVLTRIYFDHRMMP